MAQDCYKSVYKPTYNQAKTDGLSDTAAASAAQSAMNNCLQLQAAKVVPIQPPLIEINSDHSNLRDLGPTTGGRLGSDERATGLGARKK